MSDNEESQDEKQFAVERAKQGRAKCKKCKQNCAAGEIRLAKIAPNPFGEGKMKMWFHVECMFEQFLKQRPTTKRIESSDDIEGWDLMNGEDQASLQKTIEEYNKTICAKYNLSPTAKKPKSPKKKVDTDKPVNTSNEITVKSEFVDYPFREFRRLIAEITNVSSYTDKTNVVKKLFTKGPDGNGFKGDLTTWCRLLLPGVIKRVYNLQSKVLVKLFSKIFNTDEKDMLEHLEQGDIGETIYYFFENSNKVKPVKKSELTINQVDKYLEQLAMFTRQDDQIAHLTKIAEKCTSNDLKTIIRLIKHDLRMNAGAKHILDAVHPQAYESYQSCRDIKAVISKCLSGTSVKGMSNVKASISVMTPVLPMLAEACKSVEYAMKKCPNGMYSEIKYDGERVQVHKKGFDFKYFSRSLKPVMPHKIAYFKDYIPKAFPNAEDLILDCEILMVDSSGKPLPFGTLGIHKKSEFKDASVCLFVFDCLYYNGDILTSKPIKERKKILNQTMTEIPNHIMFSEFETIYKPADLSKMIAKVLQEGLEGLVLKDLHSTYEPGKRHWLKVKKDYLFGGAIADSADLLVLGAWYGTGKKGGIMSVFLMGVYDNNRDRFCTVTKVHTGHDDKTLERLQTELDMVKISSDINKVPSWLRVTKTMVPDFVARDPKKQPVWEVTGAEFTQHEVHTADGISIRFPRVTKIRDDKDWKTATNLEELKQLVKNSKHTDVSMLLKGAMDNSSDTSSTVSMDISDTKHSKTSPKGIKRPKSNQEDSSDTSSSFNLDTSDASSIKTYSSPKGKKRPKNDNDSESSSSTSSKKKFKSKLNDEISIDNPLPDYFKGVKLLVEKCKNPDFEKYLRYFIAFGGEIIDKKNWRECNFVLHNDKIISQPSIKAPSIARHIHIDWLKESVRSEEMQDFKPYIVKIVPEKNEIVKSIT